ncbi:MAG: 7-carboxy-7-deazaguanine synthase QueE [Lentisphaerae bacterium]|nr:MAG: 7-carboxy-7-deazaguanine synthase QueE [Lentisphaerota bacterium]
MFIAEIFLSFQGEGRFLGIPAFFVRTSGCNLRCQWGSTRCDSAYASWEAEQYGRHMELGEIMAQLEALHQRHPHVNTVIITGGEPTLQDELPELIRLLKQAKFAVHMESNGTNPPPSGLALDFVSLSPKLRSALGARPIPAGRFHPQTDPQILRGWLKQFECQLKFVVYCPDDESEILDLLKVLPELGRDQIWLMPEGISAEEIHRNASLVLELCYRHGFNYTPRAHIELFGNQRGF